MIYQKAMFTFRYRGWPGAQASHAMYFKHDKLKYNLVPLIDLLMETLSNVPRTFIFHKPFSLVNVTAPIANLSYGYAPPPAERFQRTNHLVFTFTFNTDENTYDESVDPKFKIRPYPGVNVWGVRARGRNNFATIGIRKSVMRDMNMAVPNLRDMAWLYMFVGAWSKNFAHYPEFYTPNEDGFRTEITNMETAFASYFHKPFQSILKGVSYDKWGYCKDMWKYAPNVVHPQSVTEHFIHYYSMFLAPMFYKQYSKSDNVTEIENKVEKYIQSGLLDAYQVLNDPNVDEASIGSSNRNFHLVRNLMRGNLEPLKDEDNIQNATRRLISGAWR